jgi:hypothetical protein
MCYLARFELDFDRLTILDLSCSPLQLGEPFQIARELEKWGYRLEPLRFEEVPQTDDFVGYLAAFLVIWPLLLATSVRGRDLDKRKRHYVIPQLLMEIVQRTFEFDGVRYFSTQHPEIRSSQDILLNYAFPAKVISDAGYCPHLKARILCTEPLPLSVFVDNPKFGMPQSLADREIRHRRRGWLSTVEGIPYEATEFGRMEYILDQLPVATVDTPGELETKRSLRASSFE